MSPTLLQGAHTLTGGDQHQCPSYFDRCLICMYIYSLWVVFTFLSPYTSSTRLTVGQNFFSLSSGRG